MAAIPPGGPAPPGGAAPAPQFDYATFYNDNSHDHAGGNYRPLMDAFVVPVANPPAPQAVAGAIYASATVDPQAFLLLVTDADHPNGRVTLFHRLQRHEAQLGHPSPFDNRVYAFMGDIVQGQAPPSVEWEPTTFHLAQTVRVPTNAVIDQAIAGDPNFALFDPIDPADAAAEDVRVRNTVLLPFDYVRLALPGPLTPRQAWVEIAGAIINDGKANDCQPLLNWLRVALVRQAAGQPSRLGRPMPPVPLATQALTERRWGLVIRDLPALSNAPANAAGHAIAASLNELVTDSRQNRQEDEVRRVADATKTPEKKFGQQGVLKLTRLCHCATADGLPNVWKDLAAAPKKQEINVIQQAFNDTASNVLQMPGTNVPITPDIANKIGTLSFSMTDDEDLSTGIHPFTFTYMNQQEVAAAYESIERYQMVLHGQGAPSLGDTAMLIGTTKINLPRTLTEATITFAQYRVAVHTLFGSPHDYTQAFERFYQMWNSCQHRLLNVKTNEPVLFPALAVRWVQLRASLWLYQQEGQIGNVAAPDFSELFNKIFLQEGWEPSMPARYLQPQLPQLPTPYSDLLGRLQQQQRVPAPREPTNPATNPPANPSNPRADEERGGIARRTDPINPVFQPFASLPLRTRDVLNRAGSDNRPPRNAGNTEMCLSYHVKGVCNLNCGRKEDHRIHSQDEDQALLGWCQQHYRPE